MDECVGALERECSSGAHAQGAGGTERTGQRSSADLEGASADRCGPRVRLGPGQNKGVGTDLLERARARHHSVVGHGGSEGVSHRQSQGVLEHKRARPCQRTQSVAGVSTEIQKPSAHHQRTRTHLGAGAARQRNGPGGGRDEAGEGVCSVENKDSAARLNDTARTGEKRGEIHPLSERVRAVEDQGPAGIDQNFTLRIQ